MFWTLDFDDFANNVCNQGRYPLIGQVGTALQAASPPAVSPSSTSLHCPLTFVSHRPSVPFFLFFFFFFFFFFSSSSSSSSFFFFFFLLFLFFLT